jgi:multidrug resistance efflux pump
MPAKRKYNQKGTKDFLVLACIFFFLCLWAVKDAWYPSPKVLEKHPLEVSVSFSIPGTVGQVYVQEGDSVGEEQVLAALRRVKIQERFDTAKKEFSAAKKKHAMRELAVQNGYKNGASDDGLSAFKAGLVEAQAEMDAALVAVTVEREKLDSTELISGTKGKVTEVMISTHSRVDVDDIVMKIDPKDHFYLFNKSLAIFSFISFWVFLGIHILAH